MARGIEGRDIFETDQDREAFLSILGSGLQRTGFACYAWALMKNHYHLVLFSTEQHLSTLMRPLNARYAQSFSKAHNRRGYLFQDRYKSIVTQDQRYVQELIRYVHANPLRAGICASIDELDQFQWTGHSVIMGRRNAPFQAIGPVLRRFGKTIDDGRRGYREFIATASDTPDDELTIFRQGNSDRQRGEPSSYVIGDHAFALEVIAKDQSLRLRLARHKLEHCTITDLALRFAAVAGIGIDVLCRRARKKHNANLRKLFAYVCHNEYGFTVVEIARFLGCTHSPMSLAARHGEEIAKNDQYAKILMALRP